MKNLFKVFHVVFVFLFSMNLSAQNNLSSAEMINYSLFEEDKSHLLQSNQESENQQIEFGEPIPIVMDLTTFQLMGINQDNLTNKSNSEGTSIGTFAVPITNGGYLWIVFIALYIGFFTYLRTKKKVNCQ